MSRSEDPSINDERPGWSGILPVRQARLGKARRKGSAESRRMFRASVGTSRPDAQVFSTLRSLVISFVFLISAYGGLGRSGAILR
jgi:hypothetical protein